MTKSKSQKNLLPPPKKPIVVISITPYDLFKKEISLIIGSIVDDISISWKILGYDTESSSMSLGHSSFSFIESIRIYNGEIEPEFVILNEILEKFCPNITILRYKKLLNDLVKGEVYCDFGELHAKKVINLKALFEWLVKYEYLNLLEYQCKAKANS